MSERWLRCWSRQEGGGGEEMVGDGLLWRTTASPVIFNLPGKEHVPVLFLGLLASARHPFVN